MKHIVLVFSTPDTKLACNIITTQAKTAYPELHIQQYEANNFCRLLDDEVIGRGCIIYAFLPPDDIKISHTLQSYNFTKLKIVTKMPEIFSSIDEMTIDTPINLVRTLSDSNHVSLLLDVFDKHQHLFSTRHNVSSGIKLIPALKDYRELTIIRAQSRCIRSSIKTTLNNTNVYYILARNFRPGDESIQHVRNILDNDVVVVMVTTKYVFINMQGVNDDNKRYWFTTYFNELYAIGKNEPKTFSLGKDCLTYSRSAEVDAIVKRQFSEYAAAMIS